MPGVALVVICAFSAGAREYDCRPFRCADAAACMAQGRLALRESGVVPAAACYFKEAMRHDPQSIEARLSFGVTVLVLGRPELATPHLRAVRDAAPDDRTRAIAAAWLDRPKDPIRIAMYYRYGTTCLHQMRTEDRKIDVASEDAANWLRRHLQPIEVVKVVGRTRSIGDVSWRTNAREQGATYAIIGTSICGPAVREGGWPNDVTTRYELFEVATGTKLAVVEGQASGSGSGGLWQTITAFRKAADDALPRVLAAIFMRDESW